MPRSTRSLPLAAMVLIVLASCGGDGDAATEDSTTSSSTTTTTSTATTTTTTTSTTIVDGEATVPDDLGDDDEGLGDPLVYAADLSGDTEVPGPGDPDATGRIEIISETADEWCIDVEATGLEGEVTDAHIHFGPDGLTGDVVVPIGTPTATDPAADPGTDTWDDVCVHVDDRLADEVLSAPDAYYANIHTDTHPDGAIRGQLGLSSIFELTLS